MYFYIADYTMVGNKYYVLILSGIMESMYY